MSRFKSKLNFQGRECFCRMNFLYQASMLMAGTNNTLSSYYGQLCKNIGKKAVLRMDPNVKRDFCKRCSLGQKPGITSDLTSKTIRKRRKKGKSDNVLDEESQIQLSCKLCGHQKHFNVNTEYKFWLENSESVVEVCTIKTDERQEKPNAVCQANTDAKDKVINRKKNKV